jgi:hypothetical protein
VGQFSLNVVGILPQRGRLSEPRVGVLFANPGDNSNVISILKGLRPNSTPNRVELPMNPIPGLNAKSRVQPWALRRNASGVELAIAAVINRLLCRRHIEPAPSVTCVLQSGQIRRLYGCWPIKGA